MSLTRWHMERARKPDVRAALALLAAGREATTSELAALGLAWLYRQGLAWRVERGTSTSWELTDEGKALASQLR